jgi:hypothetical protein
MRKLAVILVTSTYGVSLLWIIRQRTITGC